MASDLTVASAETFTIQAGGSYWSDPVYVGGTLNLGGTLYLSPGEDLAGSGVAEAVGTADLGPNENGMSASGTASAVGSATIATQITGEISASGIAEASGAAVVSAEAGQSARGTASAVGSAAVRAAAGQSAAGIASAVGTAVVGAEAGQSASGVAEATGTAVIDTLIPLRRRNTLRIDNDRTDDMRVQGQGNVDD